MLTARSDGPLDEVGGSENTTHAHGVWVLAFPQPVEDRVIVRTAPVAAGRHDELGRVESLVSPHGVGRGSDESRSLAGV